MSIIYGKLSEHDLMAMWRINEEGLPGVGKITQEALEDLLTLCELALGAYHEGALAGFVLCLLPRTRYFFFIGFRSAHSDPHQSPIRIKTIGI